MIGDELKSEVDYFLNILQGPSDNDRLLAVSSLHALFVSNSNFTPEIVYSLITTFAQVQDGEELLSSLLLFNKTSDIEVMVLDVLIQTNQDNSVFAIFLEKLDNDSPIYDVLAQNEQLPLPIRNLALAYIS